jgi:hypothetical protein
MTTYDALIPNARAFLTKLAGLVAGQQINL